MLARSAGWAVVQINAATCELVCLARGAMLVSLPVQRRIMRAELWALLQAIILTEPGGTFIKDIAAVLRGLGRGRKWCSVGRRPHADVWRRIWERFRDIAKEAHIESVTKCKAHLSKSEQARMIQATSSRQADERADELAEEGARDDSFQFIVYDTYNAAIETSRAIISYIRYFILRAKGGKRWSDVVAPPQGWDEKDERWKRAAPILARLHMRTRSGRQWRCEACRKLASDGATKAKLARTECLVHPATTDGEQARHQCHLLAQTGSFVWCCRYGAKAAKFAKKLGEPCVGQRRSQECARSMRLSLSGLHPKENLFLGSLKLFTAQAWMNGDNCDRTQASSRSASYGRNAGRSQVVLAMSGTC